MFQFGMYSEKRLVVTLERVAKVSTDSRITSQAKSFAKTPNKLNAGSVWTGTQAGRRVSEHGRLMHSQAEVSPQSGQERSSRSKWSFPSKMRSLWQLHHTSKLLKGLAKLFKLGRVNL